MAEAPLKDAIRGKDVEVAWMPFELRPLPYEALSPKSDYIQNAWRSSVKPLSERFGVKMHMPDIDPVPRTHLAHEGFQFAKEQNLGNQYVEAVLKAYWEDGLDIGQIDVLSDIARNIGLESHDFRQALEKRQFEERHQNALRHAYTEANINAVPTFFIGNQKIQGLHTKEMLEKIIANEIENNPPMLGDSCGIDGC